MPQLVKNLLAVWENWVRSLGWEDSLEGYSPWGRKESDMTERLSTHDAEPDQDENQTERLGTADPSQSAICALLSSHFQGSNSLFFHRSSKQQNPKQNPR